MSIPKTIYPIITLMIGFLFTTPPHARAQHPSARDTIVTTIDLHNIVKYRTHPPSARDTVVLLFDNDVHGALEGYSKIAYLRDSLQRQYPQIAVVSCGDFVQGSPLCTLSKGEDAIRLMNLAGYDVAVPGNHEFDYGMPQLAHLRQTLHCPMVCCNMLGKSQEPLFAPYHTLTLGTKKVCFIGVITPATMQASSPINFCDSAGNFIYSFAPDAITTLVQQSADQARKEGADFVVVLSHLGSDSADATPTSIQLIRNTYGIDAVLDGHSHHIIAQQRIPNLLGDSVVLSSTGTRFSHIGMLTLAATPAPKPRNKRKAHVPPPLRTTAASRLVATAPLPTLDDTLMRYIRQRESGTLHQTVATAPFTLLANEGEHRMVRTQETNLGDLYTDALRLASPTADIAFCNGGAIRANLPQGAITNRELYNLCPFENALCQTTLTGAQIADVLEVGAAALPYASGNFLQVSGLRYSIDTTLPSPVHFNEKSFLDYIGPARRVHSITVYDTTTHTYLPLDPLRRYTINISSYLAIGGGNALSFAGCTTPSVIYKLELDALRLYLQQTLHGTIPQQYATPQGRIRFEKKQ